MRKGRILRCVSSSAPYLTAGKEYEVAVGEEEKFIWFWYLADREAFNIIDDNGNEILSFYPNCPQAQWEMA